MYYGNLISELGDRVKELDVDTEDGKTLAGKYINRAARWIYLAHPWEWRYKTGAETLIPNYETGTCAVTQFTGSNYSDARTVSFSGSTLTSAMRGRLFQVDGETSWHKIIYVNVSAGQIVLESPITRASAGGLTFKIWKRFYYLPNDVSQIMDFGRWNNRYGRLEYKSMSNLLDEVTDISDDGNPSNFSPFGVDNYETVYTTGTISGNEDDNLITGNGTVWLGNVMPGDELIQGESVFSVKRVETNLRIILNNYIPSLISASSVYEIRRNLSIGFSFYPSNVTEYATIPFYYLDKMFDMVHEDKDRPNLPDEFDDAILSRAEFKLLKDKDNSKWASVAGLFAAELDGLKKDFRIAKPRYDIFAPLSAGYPGRNVGY